MEQRHYGPLELGPPSSVDVGGTEGLPENVDCILSHCICILEFTGLTIGLSKFCPGFIEHSNQ
jgi:hypothetical protein